MKSTLLVAMLSVAFASPSAFAKSELETLRSRCNEQEQRINRLEEANTKLRSGDRKTTATRTPAKIEKSTPTARPAGSGYTVKAGDNLDKIARNIGVNPQKLAKLNGMNTGSIIRPGQKLKVPTASIPSKAAVSATASRRDSRSQTAQQSNTLAKNSRKNGAKAKRSDQVVPLDGNATSTISANPAPNPVEKKPVPETAPAPNSAVAIQNDPASKPVSTPVPETQATPPATIAEKEKTPASSTPDKKVRAVTIEGEITYGEFATKHGTTAERLNALNGLDLTTATVLAKGSELYVPGQP